MSFSKRIEDQLKAQAEANRLSEQAKNQLQNLQKQKNDEVENKKSKERKAILQKFMLSQKYKKLWNELLNCSELGEADNSLAQVHKEIDIEFFRTSGTKVVPPVLTRHSEIEPVTYYLEDDCKGCIEWPFEVSLFPLCAAIKLTAITTCEDGLILKDKPYFISLNGAFYYAHSASREDMRNGDHGGIRLGFNNLSEYLNELARIYTERTKELKRLKALPSKRRFIGFF